ncbi:hypothetical protein HZP59_08785 [Elizabethkingia anophelis]|nr:hypothetical protein [Elizabethkingia anophelis]
MARIYKTETLLKRLESYDYKYYEAISKPSIIGHGYAMRAYHAIKMQNPPEWKIKTKAELIANELKNRGVKFNTRFLNLNN